MKNVVVYLPHNLSKIWIAGKIKIRILVLIYFYWFFYFILNFCLSNFYTLKTVLLLL